MNVESLFPTFAKLFKRIPESVFRWGAFLLLEILLGLLAVEQVSLLFFETRSYDLLFYVVGILLVLFGLFYGSFRLFCGGKQTSAKTVVTDWALWFFLAWCVVCTVAADDPLYCFTGSGYRKEGLVTYWIYASVLIAARQISSLRHKKVLLWTMGCIACLLGILTTIQSDGSLRWIFSNADLFRGRHLIAAYAAVFHNTNHFAYFLSMAIPAMAGLVLQTGRNGSRMAALLVFVISTVILLKNNTLGCILAVTVGLIFLVVIVLIRDRKKMKVCLLVLAAYAGAMVVMQFFGSAMTENAQEVSEAVAGTAEESSSIIVRLTMWKQSLGYIVRKPVFGVGPDDYRSFEFAFYNDRPHNEYLQYALFMGIPGAVSYLTALVSLFVACIRKVKKLPVEALVLGAMVLSYCVSAFMGNSMYYTTVYFAMTLGLLLESVDSLPNPAAITEKE